MKTIRKFLWPSLPALLLLSCVPATSDLAGTQWELVSLDGNAQVGEALGGQAVTIQFEDAHVGGSAGCNSYGGSYRADAGSGRITFSGLASTLMACAAQGVMETEQAFLVSLTAADRYEITLCEACANPEVLTITGGGHTLVFHRM